MVLHCTKARCVYQLALEVMVSHPIVIPVSTLNISASSGAPTQSAPTQSEYGKERAENNGAKSVQSRKESKKERAESREQRRLESR